ncbi:MAG: hypothetical protein AAF960_26700 [Bacteroidota bacterium]
MDIIHFKQTMHEEVPPPDWNNNLKALWYDGKGNWDKAHDLADGSPLEGANWIHAYLHRKEGDEWNANYWYRRAGRRMPNYSLEEEWENLVAHFLDLKER